jgi:DNA-directed RNA polymerase subunit M/transcription elongation factor TFIIS
MLCPHCNNILQKITDSNRLKYLCISCGSEYKASGMDTLIYSEDKKTYSLAKDGRSIWFYPANQKVFKACQSAKCKSKIVAWEQDIEMNKIYGCECGYSWKEIIQQSQ